MSDDTGDRGHGDGDDDGHGDGGDHGAGHGDGEPFGERRTTAPMESFEAREAAVGAAIALAGAGVAFGLPLLLA